MKKRFFLLLQIELKFLIMFISNLVSDQDEGYRLNSLKNSFWAEKVIYF